MQLRQKITATIGILGVAALAVFGAIVYPSVRAIDDLGNGISQEKLHIEESYLRRQLIRKSLEALGDARKKIGPLAAMAVREGRELDFVNALEAVETGTGVSQDINLVTANQKDLSKWEREIPLLLKVSGPFPSILKYLSNVERLPYSIVVQSMQLTESNQKIDNPLGAVDLNIQAVVYWQSKNAPAFLNSAPAAR
ncbi:MAG: hypothetical protein AAB692_02660 [Patescibacteria group bacterium]|mgnify:FL=1